MRHIIGPAAPLARPTKHQAHQPPLHAHLRTTLLTTSRQRRQAATTSASAAGRAKRPRSDGERSLRTLGGGFHAHRLTAGMFDLGDLPSGLTPSSGWHLRVAL